MGNHHHLYDDVIPTLLLQPPQGTHLPRLAIIFSDCPKGTKGHSSFSFPLEQIPAHASLPWPLLPFSLPLRLKSRHLHCRNICRHLGEWTFLRRKPKIIYMYIVASTFSNLFFTNDSCVNPAIQLHAISPPATTSAHLSPGGWGGSSSRNSLFGGNKVHCHLHP